MNKTIKTIVAAAAASFMCAVPTVASVANVPTATSITASAYYIPNSCEDFDDDFVPTLSYYNGVNNTAVYSGAHVDYKMCTGGVEVYKIDLADSRIKIPAKVKIGNTEYEVVRIGNGAFKDKNGANNGKGAALTKITFSSKSVLKEIGNEAFMNCTQLKEIKLPKSLTSIGDRAFQNSGMEMVSYTVEDRQPVSNLKTIGDEAFMNSNLTKIYIAPTTTSIGAHAFESTDLTQINFAGPSSSYLTVKSEAFAKCTKIDYIYNNRRISTGSSDTAFKDCKSNLKNLVKGNYLSEFKTRLGIK